MAASRLPMRKLRDVLRLKYDSQLPLRGIAQACGLGLGTVSTYLQRAVAAGLTWPLPEDLDDAALEARLFTRPVAPAMADRVLPNWATLHQELKKPGVTLTLLWQEYRAEHPHGYAYSQFCERYRQWARRLKPSMRQVHRAGEKLFVDFSGKRPVLTHPTTGEFILVELVVGVLGASRYVYVEACPRQDLTAWITAHVRMVEFFGGSPALLRYELGEWRDATVNIDYHAVVEYNYYSVPYQLVHQHVEVRLAAATVEIFLKGRRIASHRRRWGRGQFSTDPAHMPAAHRAHAEWTPSRLIAWAATTGPATAELVTAILAAKPHPEQGYRACLGLMRLSKHHGAERMEAACTRASHLRAPSYRTVATILATGADRVPLADGLEPPAVLPSHAHIRGRAYYTREEALCSLTPPSTN